MRGLIIGLAILTTLVAATVRTAPTDAAWTGRDHASAAVGAAYWPSSGNAYAEMGRVASASGLAFDLIAGGTVLPWPGVSAARTQAVPGASAATAAGPYRNGGVLGMVNQLTSRGTASGSAIGGSSCASYTWGPGTPTSCPSAPQKVSATGTLSSYVLRADLLLGLGALNIISIPNPVTATASCNLSAATASNTATAARATDGTGSSQGTVSVRGVSTAIPAAGATTTFDRASALFVPRVNGTITSTVTQSSTQARSTLTVDGTITYVGLVPITFRLVLADVACGTGASAVTPLAAGVPAAARVAAPEPAPTTTAPTTTPPTTTTTPPTTTTTPPTTTTTPPTTTSAEPTTTSAEPTTTSAEPTTLEQTTTTTTTTTTEPASGTVFSGTDDGAVAKFTTTEGVTCSADGAATDNVAFTCSDGSTVTLDASALTTAGVEEATVGGVWSPTTSTGSRIVVSAAVRG